MRYAPKEATGVTIDRHRGRQLQSWNIMSRVQIFPFACSAAPLTLPSASYAFPLTSCFSSFAFSLASPDLTPAVWRALAAASSVAESVSEYKTEGMRQEREQFNVRQISCNVVLEGSPLTSFLDAADRCIADRSVDAFGCIFDGLGG